MANNNRLLAFGAVAVVAFLFIEHKKKTEAAAIAPGANPPKLPLPAIANPPHLPASANPPKLPPIRPNAAPPMFKSVQARIAHFQSNPEVEWKSTPAPIGYWGAYNVAIPNSNTTVRLLLTPFDPNTTIKINDSAVRPGVWSAEIPLKVGQTGVDVTGTAKDGSVNKTRVYFNRAAGSLKGIGYTI